MAIGLLATVAGSVGFVVAFVTDASTAWLGGSLAAALLGLGMALAYWGRDLAGDEVISGPYPVPHDDAPGAAALGGDLEQSAGVITRRGALAKFLVLRRRRLRPQPGRHPRGAGPVAGAQPLRRRHGGPGVGS